MIKRNRHIPRVAHEVDYPLVFWLKGLMTFEHARPLKLAQESVTIEIDFRDPGFDVGKPDRITLVDQISQKKACPGVAGSGVGNQKNVIGKNRQAAARNLPSGKHTPRLREGAKHPLCATLSRWHCLQPFTSSRSAAASVARS